MGNVVPEAQLSRTGTICSKPCPDPPSESGILEWGLAPSRHQRMPYEVVITELL